MTTTIVLLSCLAGAPVPVYRPLPPAPVVGTWVIHWGGTDGSATFRPDGTCTTSGGWEGKWKWDSRKRVLSVDEGLSAHMRIRWSVQLDKNLSGAMLPENSDRPSMVHLRKR